MECQRKPDLLPSGKLIVNPLLQVLLETNTAGNLQLVVQVAKEYTEQLGAGKIMELLESHKNYHGLYYYLGGHIAFSEDPEVGFSCVHTTLEFPLPLPQWHSTSTKAQEVSMPHLFWQAGRPQAPRDAHASSQGNSALSRDCKPRTRAALAVLPFS